MTAPSFNILQVSTVDQGGGAERIALNLHQQFTIRGHDAIMAVGRKKQDDPTVVQIPNESSSSRWSLLWANVANQLHRREHRLGNTRRLRAVANAIGRPKAWLDSQLGREHFDYPGTGQLLTLSPRRADLIHLHNLHGNYFDLRCLPELSRQVPVFVTLHDAWLLSGHCAHSLGCVRWQTGCGHCPDLGIYPALRRDGTAGNWRRKRDIYAQSKIHLIAPSQWMLDKVLRSILAPAVQEARVIPNGVDQTIFRPGDQQASRSRLELPSRSHILLFVANGIRRGGFKDIGMLQEAVRRVGHTTADRSVLFLALGDEGPSQRLGKAELRFIPKQSDPQRVADYYRAADVYVHAAQADTFPTTVIEALACGTPVVASKVGGIPEQVDHGQTGLLVEPGDASRMGVYLNMLLGQSNVRWVMAKRAAVIAARQFNVQTQVDRYLAWYRQIVDQAKFQETRLAA